MVKVSDLANEIVRQVELYTEEVKSEVKVIKDDVSKMAVQELKQNSPKLTGDYANHWDRKKDGENIIIYNKAPDYRLTHLLEFGHAKADGGRVAAHPHIRPVEEQVVNEYVDRVEKAVQS